MEQVTIQVKSQPIKQEPEINGLMLLPLDNVRSKKVQKKTLKFPLHTLDILAIYLCVPVYRRLYQSGHILGRPFPYDFVHFISGQTMTLRVTHIARVKGRCF